MTEQELKKIAGKIAKLLALTSSNNPNEAAAAKRQADALMKKYNLTQGDVDASRVNQQQIKSGGKYSQPLYLGALAATISKAFGCLCIGHSGGGWRESTIEFLGIGIKPELAAYTFDVLARQIKKDRKTYQATLKRFKPKNKQRMADLFCQTWVAHIQTQVHEFAGTEQEKQAIKAYQKKQYGSTLKKDTRNAAQAQKDQDYDAYNAGAKASRDVSIHKPVQSKRNALLEST